VTVAVARTAPATDAQWDEIWHACDYATWFHSRGWAEAWQRYSHGGMRPSPRLVRFSDGCRALLPLSVQASHLGLLRLHLSSPAGTFGGWISADALSAAHATLLGALLQANVGALVWRLNPYDPTLEGIALPPAAADETHVLDLRAGFEAVHRRWTKGHASAARKAAREGVTIAAARSLDEWRAYYALYEASLARWGEAASSRYGWELFEALAGWQEGGVRLWLARHDGEVVAGALCLYARRHVAYWHGAALASRFELRPVNLVLHDAIRDACERGYDWFDFNPSGGHAGVAAFKRSFGAEARPAPVVTVETRRLRLARRLAGMRRRVGR
jgi:CelD/BcsL family acetyltransferase involved in cellulose biosynthesis